MDTEAGRRGRGADMLAPTTVLHWFDFICPFCYVAQ
ncbi:DsbA family protein [Planotetraspora phitsanulokensis]|nr:DsbA family protein [Planotetraspora phitsanulokensis]